MGKGIKIKMKCCLCNRWKYTTHHHERARGFVCRHCFEWLENNPTYSNMPFKGWGFHEKKEKSRG